MAARLAVFASGGGTNLQALIDHFHAKEAPDARVELLIVSRAGIGAVARASTAGVPSAVVGPEDTVAGRITDLLTRYGIDLIVLAGYLRLVPDEVIELFRDRIINIHPALLPLFGGQGMYGMRVHRAVIEAGVRVSGATVHLVDEDYDRGRILAQWPVPVLRGDTPESLAARVLRVEHRLLPRAVEALVNGGPLVQVADPLAFEIVPAEAPAASSLDALLL